MKVSSRIFMACLALACLCLYFPLNRIADTLGIHYREGVEDSLVDQANILAAMVEDELRRDEFSETQWRRLFTQVQQRSLGAQIYQLQKERVDAQVYITDSQGRVVFDSACPANIGQDFSQWRDVYATLQGRYGARTSRSDPEDESTSMMHVAAPIYKDGHVAGVLTLIKPTTNIRAFVSGAQLKILESGLIYLFFACFCSWMAAYWITRPIKALTRYARGVRDGQASRFPRLDNSEIGEMGRAFAEMQATLEGKRYVEQYVEHLSHELKSPLSAIRGAAELLGEPMDEEPRQRFATNVKTQSLRIQEIVERMLELASLESRALPPRNELVKLSALAQVVAEDKAALLFARNLRLELRLTEDSLVLGDAFLLHQAMANLVQNAIDFSPEQSVILLQVERRAAMVACQVRDQGPGIPDYAWEKIFDKFFSLQRPHNAEKSTGLGLNFVQQIIMLHGGKLVLDNLPEGGLQALFEIPGQ